MPHSGGGGSHSGGGHHGGGSHHSSSGSSSSRNNVRVSNTPFHGCHTYAVYGKNGSSRLVYSDSSNYHAETTKKDVIPTIIFGSIFALPGVVELIIMIVMLVISVHFGLRVTNVPDSVDNNVYIYDEYDYVTAEEEAELIATLEDFRDKTGIIPAVEFTNDDWIYEYVDMESFAYNEYVCKFYDEYHLLIVYSVGPDDEEYDFHEFYWESMWGDALGKTARSSDEDYLADRIQANVTRANGTGVAKAIADSFDEFYQKLSAPGLRFDAEKLFIALFLFVHGGIFFGVGIGIIIASVKKLKKSNELGETTYKINGEPVVKKCAYCGTAYYQGTVGNCPNCGAPLDI